MIWNSKTTTYYSKGRKAYGIGDPIPADVIEQMGESTLAEYIGKGWILDGKAGPAATAESEAEVEIEDVVKSKRDVLFERAKNLGLKPNYRIGVLKLEVMLDDYEALRILKAEALALGIDPSDDVDFAELTELVDEKKALNESDS